MPGSPLRDDAVPVTPATSSTSEPARRVFGRLHSTAARLRRWRGAAVLPRLVMLVLLAGGALGLALAAAPAPAAAADQGAKAAAAGDPVVAQVIQMLQGGVSSPVILAWLQKSGKRPAVVEGSDLVALHKAGASDELLHKLIDLAQPSAPPASGGEAQAPAQAAPTPAAPAPAPAPPPPAAPAPAPAPASRAAAPAAPAAAVPAPPAVTPPPSPAAIPVAPPAPPSAAAIAAPPEPASPPAPQVAAAAAALAGGAVNVKVAVTYRPVFVEGEDPWSLYVYVDGRLLCVVDAGPAMLPLPSKKFERVLGPGRHVLRLAQERHRRFNHIVGYLTPTRMDADSFPFELAAGAPAEIAIHFGEKSFRHPGPVAVKVEQGGRQILASEPPAEAEERWPAVCEDIAASLPANEPLRGQSRKDKDRCVTWPSLWPSIAGLPSRDEVRAEIDRQRHAQETR